MAQLSLFYLHIKTYGQNVTSYNFNFLEAPVFNLSTYMILAPYNTTIPATIILLRGISPVTLSINLLRWYMMVLV